MGLVEERDKFGYTSLQRACKTGDAEKVEHLLLQGIADPHAEIERRGGRPLHVAAKFGHECVVKSLLNHGAVSDIWHRDYEGNTTLHYAALNGNVHILSALWSHFPAGSSLDLQNGKLQTPLHLAAGKGNLDAVNFFLQNGANKNSRDAYGATPFHFGARCGHTMVMEVLMDDPNIASYKGFTALHYASWNGHKDAVEWLLARNAYILAKDLNEDTPLHWAARRGCMEVINTLIRGGANVCAINKKGELAVDLVDESKRCHAVMTICRSIKLLESQKKLEVDQMALLANNTQGATLLHYMAAYGTSDAIEWVVSKISKEGEDDDMYTEVNVCDMYGRNPMHWAAWKGNKNPDIIQTLARSRVNLQAKDEEGSTPLTYALIHQHLTLAEELIKVLGNRVTAEQWISNWDTKIKMILKSDDKDLLMKLGEALKEILHKIEGLDDLVPQFQVNHVLEKMPPLWTALHIGEEGIARLIQQYDKDAVNKKETKTGRTTLHWATILKQKNIVVTLCRKREFEKEMLANVEDKFGKTALQYATEMHMVEIMKELVQTKDVQSWLDRLYQDRQVYVDAANAILVGAALIASVTFAGWLQPPLGDIAEVYPTHIGVRAFCAFNSLSFFFAIATVLAGATAVLPMPELYIATVVSIIRRSLFSAAFLFSISIVFVLGAFAAAGFVVLPSLLKYQANMIGTVCVGAIPCLWFLGLFLSRLYMLRPGWFKVLQKLLLSSLGKGDPSVHKEDSKKDKLVRSLQHVTDHIVQFKVYPSFSPENNSIEKYEVGPRYRHIPWEDGLDKDMGPNICKFNPL